MTKTNHSVSRRQALGGIGVAAFALTPTALAAAGIDRSAWNAAVARYKLATEQMSREGDRLTSIHDACEAACPRKDEYFSRYNLGGGDTLDQNFRAAHMSLVIERAKGRHLTREEASQTMQDALRLANEFEDYHARREAAFAGYDEKEARFDELVSAQSEAFRVVLKTPAPDNEALLYKVQILSAYLDEADSEDAERVGFIRADAQRLLATGRA